jgi:hypothetical protein
MAGPIGQDYPAHAQAPYSHQPLGYRQLSVTGGAQTLVALLAAATPAYTLSGQERAMAVEVEGNSIRWIDDKQAPTTSYGRPIAPGLAAWLMTDFSQVQVIATTGTATVNVSFYK